MIKAVVTHFLTLLLKSNLQVDCYYSSLNIKFDYMYKNMSDIHVCMYDSHSCISCGTQFKNRVQVC